MKALVVLPEPPLVEGTAAGRCAVGLLRGLRGHGVEVRAVAPRRWFAVPGEPPRDLDVTVVDVPLEADPDASRSPLLTLRRPLGALAEIPALADAVRSAGADADVVHLEQTETLWCAQQLSAPSLVHVHSLLREDRPVGPPWRQGFRRALETVLAERRAAALHAAVVASSPFVADRIRVRYGRSDVVVAPLTLTPEHYERAPLTGPPTAGMIGTAAWPTTRAAAERLVHRVWPDVRRRVPEATLVLAGRGFDAVPGLEGEGVELAGPVESAAAFLRRLSLLLYPIERGSGMKVKVLESLACGLPVVTTARGAEGVADDAGLVVEEVDARLAAAAATILRDDGERRERGAAGRAAFLRRYAPAPATEPLVDLYESLAR